MEKISRIGMDTSKRIFQLHGVDGAEQPVLRKKQPRERMIAFFKALPPTVVALEACGASHHWARVLGAMGHTAKLIAPQLAKPYVNAARTTPPTPKRCARRPAGRRCATFRSKPRSSKPR